MSRRPVLSAAEPDLRDRLLGRHVAGEIGRHHPWVPGTENRVYEGPGHQPLQRKLDQAQACLFGYRLESVDRIVSEDVVREIPGDLPAILAWQGKPEITLHSDAAGGLRLDEERLGPDGR